MSESFEGSPFQGFESQFSGLTAAAVQVHELYQAYVDAGFTPDQAMQLLVSQIYAAHRCGGWDE